MGDGRPMIVLDDVMARWNCPRGYVEDVAAAIVLAVVDERAVGRVYNVAEPVAFSEAEWVRRIGEVVGWWGEVMTVPVGRMALPYRFEQDLDTDSGRIRRELTIPSAARTHRGEELGAGTRDDGGGTAGSLAVPTLVPRARRLAWPPQPAFTALVARARA
jgi:hypothetical protein